jgi:hypothetical protein
MKISVALIFAASTLLMAGCCSTPHVTKWEYKQSPTQVTDETLNKWADEG